MAKAKTNTQRVIALIKQGKSVKEIVQIAKVSPQLVYGVKYKLRKEAERLAVPGIDPKAPLAPSTGIAGLANRPRMIREHDEPVVSKESFWSKLWRIIWK